MKSAVLICLVFASSVYCEASSLNLLVLTGTSTPEAFLAQLSEVQVSSWLPQGFKTEVAQTSEFEVLASKVEDVLAVIDATFSLLEVEMVAGLCDMSGVPHLVLDYVSVATLHPWTYYLSGRYQDLARNLDTVVASFGWTEVNVLSDEKTLASSVSDFLESSQMRSYQSMNFPLSEQTSVSRIVGISLRMTGNRACVVLTSSEVTKRIVAAQWDMQIGGVGYANVLILLSSLFQVTSGDTQPNLSTGNLILAEEELSGVLTEAGYYQALLTRATSLLIGFTDCLAVKNHLDQLYPSHYRDAPYVLLNMQSGLRVSVGLVHKDACTITAPIYFLGNTTDVPQNIMGVLPISANFGVRNPTSYSTSVLVYYNGAMLAAHQINVGNSLLANYNINIFNFTAGVQIWDYKFAYENVFPVLNNLGFAVLTGVSSDVTLGLIGLLKDLNYSGPVIGSSNTADVLSSKTIYPNYIRTVVADQYTTSAYVQIFLRFGWSKCGLFVSNETWGMEFRSVFTDLAAGNGIQILNDPTLQILPSSIPTIDTLKGYTKNFKNFLDTKCRILIIVVSNNPIFVIDYLYEMGARAGDVQVLANKWLSLDVIGSSDFQLYQHRSILLRGAMQLSPAGFIGTFGKQVQADYIKTYGEQPDFYSCYYYDSVLALGYTFDTMVNLGKDFTNFTIFFQYLREIRFKGCTGTVTIDPASNDRSPVPYSILNAQYGANSTISTIAIVGMYDPTSTIVLSFSSDITWCDGTTTVPEDMRKSSIDCPFEDKFNQDFPAGRYLLYGLGLGIVIITTVLSVLVSKLGLNLTMRFLTEKQEMKTFDFVVLCGLGIEMIQYMSMGPDLGFLPTFVGLITKVFAFDFSDLFSYHSGGYEIVLFCAFGLLLLWLIMSMVVLFQLDYKYESVPGCRVFGDLSETLVLKCGDFLFLPIVSVLMNVFVCTKGVASSTVETDFFNSYLSSDCYLSCWNGIHLLYIVCGSIGLLIYVPLVVILRPVWQEIHDQINIKTSTLFMMVKTVVQICIIFVNKALIDSNPVIHSCIFLAIFAVFLAFCMKKTCFGYNRAAFWHKISLLVVIWSAFLGLIRALLSQELDSYFLALTLSGCCGLVVFGLGYQHAKLPNLLYRKQGVNTNNLFKFAFKRTTLELLNALKDSLSKVGNRTNVVNPIVPTDLDPIQITSVDYMNTSLNLTKETKERDLIETVLD